MTVFHVSSNCTLRKYCIPNGTAKEPPPAPEREEGFTSLRCSFRKKIMGTRTRTVVAPSQWRERYDYACLLCHEHLTDEEPCDRPTPATTPPSGCAAPDCAGTKRRRRKLSSPKRQRRREGEEGAVAADRLSHSRSAAVISPVPATPSAAVSSVTALHLQAAATLWGMSTSPTLPPVRVTPTSAVASLLGAGEYRKNSAPGCTHLMEERNCIDVFEICVL